MPKKPDKKEKIIIKFNKNLYNLKTIKLAIKEYQNLANFNLQQKGKYFQVELKNIDKEVRLSKKDAIKVLPLFEKTMDEFLTRLENFDAKFNFSSQKENI